MAKYYKMREPEETISIVKNFFLNLDKNFSIEINESESGVDSYSCVLCLKYNDYIVERSNGKGVTPIYARASGYAELYERFCCEMSLIGRYCSFNSLMPKKTEQSKSESKEDKIKAIKNILFQKETSDNPHVTEFCCGVIDEVDLGKFENIFDKSDVQYIEKHALGLLFTSNGMCAGNSKIECINQGISELAERSVLSAVVDGAEAPQYELSDEFLKTLPEIYKIVENIRKNELDIRFFDFSYQTGMPVIMAVTTDKKNMDYLVNFGSFPDIEIAIQRTITETFQGRSIQNNDFKNLIPFKSINDKFINKRNAFASNNGFLPEYIFSKKVTKINRPNYDVYINSKSIAQYDAESLNQAIFNQWEKILRDNNIKVYGCDMSLTKDMYAYWLFSYELNGKQPSAIADNLHGDDIRFIDSLVHDIYLNSISIQKSKTIVNRLIKIVETSLTADMYLYARFAWHSFDSLVSDYIIFILSLYNGDYETAQQASRVLKNSILYYNSEKARKIIDYSIFKLTGLYSDEELVEIFTYFGVDMSEINIIEECGREFLDLFLNKVLFGEDYDKFLSVKGNIQSLINKKRCLNEK